MEGKFKGTNLTAFAETYPYKLCKVVTEALLRACDEQPVRAMDVLAAEVDSDSEPADDEADSSQEGDPDQPDQPDPPEAEIRVPSRDKAYSKQVACEYWAFQCRTDATLGTPMQSK